MDFNVRELREFLQAQIETLATPFRADLAPLPTVGIPQRLIDEVVEKG